MVLCSINGANSYVHRVRDLGKTTRPRDIRPLAIQFREALAGAQHENKVVYASGFLKVATCACGQAFAAGGKRRQCSDCEAIKPEPKAPKPKPELPNPNLNPPGSYKFTCPYCLERDPRTRDNQATCKRRECQRKHWAILKRINRY